MSYEINVRVLVGGKIRSQYVDRAPTGILVGFLRGLADSLEADRGELTQLTVEHSSTPEAPFGTHHGLEVEG